MIELIGFLFTVIIGTLGHFLYKWFNLSILKFIFSKDESLYSHLKLGITPMMLFMIVEKKYFINNNIIFIKGIAIAIYILLITLVYLFGKLIKKEISYLNISSYYISVFISYMSSLYMQNIIIFNLYIKIIGYIAFILIILSYFIFNWKSSKDD